MALSVVTTPSGSVQLISQNVSKVTNIIQGTSLWENDGSDHVKPKGGKTVDAPYLELGGKVDVVSGKGLSTEDYTTAEKTKLTDLPLSADLTTALGDKVDKVAGKVLSDNNYTDAEVLLVADVVNKEDKVAGKGLSTNDYTDADETKVGYITASGSGDKALMNDASYRLISTLTGFNNQDDVIVNYDSTAKTITLTGTFSATYKGQTVAELVTGWVSDPHDSTAGIYYLWYDGTFHFTTDPWIFDSIQIASVIYNGDKFALKETHGNVMSADDHEQAHQTIGCYKTAGGDFLSNSWVANSTTAVDRRPLISETTIKDEDLRSVLPALSTEVYTTRYLTGTNTREFTTDYAEIIPVTGSTPNWNQYTGGAWQQTPFTNNQYGAIFVAAIPVTSDATSQKYRYIFVQPQTVSTTLTVIQGLTPSSLTLGDPATLVAEYCFIGKIIVRYVGPSTNNWVVTSIQKLEGTKISQIAITSSPPSASAVSYTPTGNVSATDVQSAITELDTEKLTQTGSANDLTFTDTNSHYTTDEVGEALVQAGVEIDALELLARPTKYYPVTIESDFYDAQIGAVPGLVGSGLSSGTITTAAGSANHPGVVTFRDSTTANGGYMYGTFANVSLVASGGMSHEIVFNFNTARNTAIARSGWMCIHPVPTDGLYFEITGDGTKAVFKGVCGKVSAYTVTASTFQIELNTWYSAKMETNADVTLVTFTLYAENGTQIWTDTVATNIPTRTISHKLFAFETSTDAATDILSMDYVNWRINKALVR